MKKIILILSIILTLPLFGYSDGPQPLTVMAPSGIRLRENPSINSKVLKGLPFGYIVNSTAPLYRYSMAEYFKSDTISGVFGYWIDAEYQGINGYVFSPYVYNFYNQTIIDTNITENSLKITHEGLFHGECDYHPDLLWYGIYYDSEGFEIREINVKIRLSKEEPEFFEAMGSIDELSYGCNYDGQIFLETDTNEKSLFLIGTGKKWIEGSINYSLFNEKLGYYQEEGYIYPEQKRKIKFNGYNYYLRAYDSVSVDNNCKITKTYQLELVNNYRRSYQSKETKKFNLSGGLHLYGDGKKHSKYYTPQIHFAGDINKDGLLDLIIYQFSMANHGGVSNGYTLFLSEIGDHSEIKFKVDGLNIQSCR